MFISEGGCKESLATHGVVAGLWSASYSLGEVIGPSVGGLLLEHHGFPVASTVMAAINFALVIICSIYFPCKNRKTKEIKSEDYKRGRNDTKSIEDIRYAEHIKDAKSTENLTPSDANSDKGNNVVGKAEQIERGEEFKDDSTVNIYYIEDGCTNARDSVQNRRKVDTHRKSAENILANVHNEGVKDKYGGVNKSVDILEQKDNEYAACERTKECD